MHASLYLLENTSKGHTYANHISQGFYIKIFISRCMPLLFRLDIQRRVYFYQIQSHSRFALLVLYLIKHSCSCFKQYIKPPRTRKDSGIVLMPINCTRMHVRLFVIFYKSSFYHYYGLHNSNRHSIYKISIPCMEQRSNILRSSDLNFFGPDSQALLKYILYFTN